MRSSLGFAGIALASAFLLGFGSAARAGDYLIDPTGGTDLTSLFSDPDDGFVSRFTGFPSFTLFDLTRTGGASGAPINVTTNGFLHLRAVGEGGNASPANAALPTGGGIHRIAGLWDDLYLESRTSDSVTETKGENYYAVTYLAHKAPMGGDIQFQIALFGGNVTLGGYNFKANDIAFSYHKLVGAPVGGTATVGLDAGNGADFIGPADFPNGLVDDFSKLKYFSATGGGAETGFYVFAYNPDAPDGYDARIIATGGGTPGAAPEPGTLALLGLGVSLMGGVSLRRRRG